MFALHPFYLLEFCVETLAGQGAISLDERTNPPPLPAMLTPPPITIHSWYLPRYLLAVPIS